MKSKLLVRSLSRYLLQLWETMLKNMPGFITSLLPLDPDKGYCCRMCVA